MTKFSLDGIPRGERRTHPDAPYRADGTDRFGRIGFDAPRVTRDEALELMVHYLKLAAAYFQATPEDEDANFAEMTRLMTHEIPGHEDPALIAARLWFATMRAHYERLKAEQDDPEDAPEDGARQPMPCGRTNGNLDGNGDCMICGAAVAEGCRRKATRA